MAVQLLVGLAFVLLAGSLAAVFVGVALDSRTEPWDGLYARAGLIRRWWFLALLVFALVVFVVSMTWLPYQAVRNIELPGPATAVTVTAEQFDFALSSSCVPAGHPVEFSVRSKDVTHGFAIYDADGRIVGQVQAMPGFTNVLRVSFPKPGTYTLHCDELCGPGHPFMKGALTVGDCGGSGGSAAGAATSGCAGGCA
jgi:cytochrome c oxidase subunit II